MTKLYMLLAAFVLLMVTTGCAAVAAVVSTPTVSSAKASYCVPYCISFSGLLQPESITESNTYNSHHSPYNTTSVTQLVDAIHHKPEPASQWVQPLR